MKARDIMTKEVATVRPETSLAAVAQIMLEYRIGSVLVVDKRGKLCGIITETDFAAKERGVPFSVHILPQVFSQLLSQEAVERHPRCCADDDGQGDHDYRCDHGRGGHDRGRSGREDAPTRDRARPHRARWVAGRDHLSPRPPANTHWGRATAQETAMSRHSHSCIHGVKQVEVTGLEDRDWEKIENLKSTAAIEPGGATSRDPDQRRSHRGKMGESSD